MRNYLPDRIVFDTNIYISFIIQNKLDKLIALIEKYDLEIFICDELLKEIKATLNKPHIKSKLSFKAAQYIEVIALISENIIIDKRFDRIIDPDDNFLIDLAYCTKSYFLITEDKLILNHKQINKIKIINMAAFKKMLSELK
ncbi:MAG: putative toxin-antitoxin system toxin component, PIN family [Chitinophagales bacterium]